MKKITRLALFAILSQACLADEGSTSPVFARLDLYAGNDDRVALYCDGTFDISGEAATQGMVSNVVWRTARPGLREHVRVVPYMVTGTAKTDGNGNEQFVLLDGQGASRLVQPRVVAEFDLSPDEKPTLTEADFLKDGMFDIDWKDCLEQIIRHENVVGVVEDVTAIRYRLVFGYEGTISDADAEQAGLKVEAFKYLVERRFERSASRTTPTGLHTGSGAGASRPTFRWRLDEPVSWGVHPSAAQLGCSYTAFQIQVTNLTTHAFFDSGVLRAPVRDASREFAWTPLEGIAPATGDWKWRVAMYNAKLKPITREDKNGWTEWTPPVERQKDGLTTVECAVYSDMKSDSPLRVATVRTNDYWATKALEFPSSYTGHRSVCFLQSAQTNLPFCAWIGGPEFIPGDFFGCSNLRSARQIELSRTSPVFARLDLYAGTDDRVALYGDGTFDISGEAATQGMVSNVVWRTARLGLREHVRVVPYMVTGTAKESSLSSRGFVLLDGQGASRLVQPRVVAEFDLSPDEKPTLTEADFLKDGKFDIDWENFSSKILNETKVINAVGDVTAIRYRLVFGYEGTISDSDAEQAGLKVEAFKYLVERRFEPSASRTTPTGLHTGSGDGASRPTFRWRLDEPVTVDGYRPIVNALGCSYTAFQIQVTNLTTHAFFDSGVLRAPVRDASREFAWTPSDGIAPAAGDWKWRVAMYNAKFKPSSRGTGGFSEWSEVSQ